MRISGIDEISLTLFCCLALVFGVVVLLPLIPHPLILILILVLAVPVVLVVVVVALLPVVAPEREEED